MSPEQIERVGGVLPWTTNRSRLKKLYKRVVTDHDQLSRVESQIAGLKLSLDRVNERFNGVEYGLGHLTNIIDAFIARMDRDVIAAEDQRRDVLECLIHGNQVGRMAWRPHDGASARGR